MDTLLSMPMPMASALMVLMAIGAFFFIKVLALAMTPPSGRRICRVVRSTTVICRDAEG